MLARAVALGLVVLLALVLAASALGAFGYLGQWGGSGTGNGKFQAPFGIATDASGNVYVADCSRNDVQKFDANGAYLTKWGTGGTGNSQFDCARDVAVDATGVYVVDFNNNRVQKFDTTGGYLSQFDNSGVHGVFDEPVGIATDGTNVYVVDTGPTSSPTPRLQRFSTTGTWQALIGSGGTGAGQYDTPIGVTTDTSGAVYVSDQGNSRVVKFDALGLPATVGGARAPATGSSARSSRAWTPTPTTMSTSLTGRTTASRSSPRPGHSSGSGARPDPGT